MIFNSSIQEIMAAIATVQTIKVEISKLRLQATASRQAAHTHGLNRMDLAIVEAATINKVETQAARDHLKVKAHDFCLSHRIEGTRVLSHTNPHRISNLCMKIFVFLYQKKQRKAA